jgi:hypothetical protein
MPDPTPDKQETANKIKTKKLEMPSGIGIMYH